MENQFEQFEGDAFFEELKKHRFYTLNKDGSADLFMYAWTMIRTDSFNTSIFFTKLSEKHLKKYAEQLCLYKYPNCNDHEKEILEALWRDFAFTWFDTCNDPGGYGSVAWGLKSLEKSDLYDKMRNEIFIVTKEFPSRFDLEELFLPFHRIMIASFEEYCNH